METEEKRELNRIVNYFKAVASIDQITTLEAKTMFWLGRLSDFCLAPTRSFEKARDKAQAESNKRISELQETYKSAKEEDRSKLLKEIQEISEALNEKIQELLFQEEPVRELPKFKLSEFMAKEEIKDKGVKKGQSLVHQGFFTLMGDLIEDDL